MRKKASRIAVIDCAPGCGKTAITFKKPTLESSMAGASFGDAGLVQRIRPRSLPMVSTWCGDARVGRRIRTRSRSMVSAWCGDAGVVPRTRTRSSGRSGPAGDVPTTAPPSSPPPVRWKAERSALAASVKTTLIDRRAFSRIRISKIAPGTLVSSRRLLAATRDSAAPTGLVCAGSAAPTGLVGADSTTPSGLVGVDSAAPSGLVGVDSAAPSGLICAGSNAPTGLGSGDPPACHAPRTRPFRVRIPHARRRRDLPSSTHDGQARHTGIAGTEQGCRAANVPH